MDANVSLLQIDKLKNQAGDKEAELLKLLELTPIQMWNTDLDAFMAEWDVSFRFLRTITRRILMQYC